MKMNVCVREGWKEKERKWRVYVMMMYESNCSSEQQFYFLVLQVMNGWK